MWRRCCARAVWLRGVVWLFVLFVAVVAFAHEEPSAELVWLDGEVLRAPFRIDLLLRRSALRLRLGHKEAALRDAERACGFATVEREVLLSRGLARLELGFRAEALCDLDRYVRSGPSGFEAFLARARLHWMEGRFFGARRDFDSAIAVRALPEFFLERGRLDEEGLAWELARAGYREGLEKTGGAVSVRLALIRLERRGRHFSEALLLVEEARGKASFQADWLLLRAEIEEEMGRLPLALRDREAALLEASAQLLKRPTDLVRLTRARALFALGRVAEARDEALVLRERSASLPDVIAFWALLDKAGAKR